MDPISRASYLASVARSLEKCFAAWNRIPPLEWCEEVYRLAKGGRFRWTFAPYTKRMFLSLFEPATISTDFMLYSRGLKSTVILMALGYLIDQAPRRILVLWPTNSQAERWSKDDLCGNLLDSTQCLNYLGNQGNRRLSSNTILMKIFPGGLINAFGANAPGDLRRAKGSFLYADEIDAIEETLTDEGDQLKIFERRGSEYPDTIQVCASYPSVRGRSRIASRMEDTDLNQWFSTCVLCGGEPFVMERTQLRYEDGKPKTARLECPRCKGLLTDAQRYAMAHKQGFDNWKPQREFRGKRGFHANSMLWPHPVDVGKFPGGYLQMLAQAEIDAERSDNPKRAMRVLVNTIDAEPFDPTSEDEKPPPWQPLFERCEDYDAVPSRGLVITGAGDLQLNRIELEYKAWGRGEESWGLCHVVIDGDIRDSGTWELLKTELRTRKFVHESGAPMDWSLCFIDGGKWGDLLLRFLGEIGRVPVPNVTGKVKAVAGRGAWPHPILTDYRSIAKNLKGYQIGTWQIKDLVNRRLAMVPDRDTGALPEGWMHWNTSFTEQYFRQLCTAKASVDYVGSEEIRKFLNLEHLRDEALDLNVYNYAAFRMRRWNFDGIENELKAKAEAAQNPPKQPERKRDLADSFIGSTNHWL